jgi:hypothetical protein
MTTDKIFGLREKIVNAKSKQEIVNNKHLDIIEELTEERDGLAELLSEIDWTHSCCIELSPHLQEAIEIAKAKNKVVDAARKYYHSGQSWASLEGLTLCDCLNNYDKLMGN